MKHQTPPDTLIIKIPDMRMNLDFSDPGRHIAAGMRVRFELWEGGIVANLVLSDCFYRRRIELRPGDRSFVELPVRRTLRRSERYPFVIRRKWATGRFDAPRSGPRDDPEPIEEDLDANPGT